jgi:predicted DNA-binding transcriptional regulator AlpA
MTRKYLPGPKVAERYGWSAQTTYRRRRFDPDFPAPVTINGRHYYPEDQLDAYDDARVNGGNDKPSCDRHEKEMT